MTLISVHDKRSIESFLRQNIGRHFYELGDLDDRFWPKTVWYANKNQERICQMMLLYFGLDVPVILGFAEESHSSFEELLLAAMPLLPSRLYAHISIGYFPLFSDYYQIQPFGTYYQMVLRNRKNTGSFELSGIERLEMSDVSELESLYHLSYPENWFEVNMLDMGLYYGIRMDGRIVCAAGVHVYSPTLRVAAVGNIVTHPEYRNRGLAKCVTTRLLNELENSVDHIGLNVRDDNHAAISCYRQLGFEVVGRYDEFMLSKE